MRVEIVITATYKLGKCVWYYRWMEFVPWFNVWRKCEVGEVDDNIVRKMVVLLVVWSNWVILVDNLNNCTNGTIVQSARRKDVPVSQGNSCSDTQVRLTLVTF